MKRFFSAFAVELKILYKSFWSLVYFVPPIILTYMTIKAFNASTFMDNLGTWVSCNGYITVYTGFAALIIGVFTAHSKNALLEQLFTPVKRINIKLLSAVVFTGSVVLIPVAVLIIYSIVRPISAPLFLNYLDDTLILWITQSVFYTATGFFIGTVIKREAAYFVTLIPALVFSLFISVVVNTSSVSVNPQIPNYVLCLLNSGIDNPQVEKFLSQGVSFNSAYLFDKLFIVILSVFFYLLSVCLSYKRASRAVALKTGLSSILVFALLSGDVLCAAAAAPRQMGAFAQNLPEKLQISTVQNDGVTVESYTMDTYLRENFKNTCEMKLNYTGGDRLGELNVRLDDSLKIDSVAVNGKKTAWSRKDDEVTLNGMDIPSGAGFKISFKYHGRINYAFIMGYRAIYADNDCALLPEEFAWYPTLGYQDKPISYDIDLHAKNRVVTNLTISGSHLTGSKNGIYLSTGYYKTAKIDGAEVTCGEELVTSKEMKGFINNIVQDKEIGELDHNGADFSRAKSGMRPAAEILKSGRIVLLPAPYIGMNSYYYFGNDIIVCE